MTGRRRPAPGSIAFLPPRLPGVLVRRPMVEARLGPDLGASWSLVVGPPGSGKTTLVRSWLERRREPWAWVSVTAAPYQRSNVVDLLVRAVQRARAERPLDALDSLDMHDLGPQPFLAMLLDELAADVDESPVSLLVVDDAHLLDVDEWTLLGWFLAQLPSTIHPVVVTRTDPPIQLARERANGRVSEVRARDLAFVLSDTEQLLLATTTGTSAQLAQTLQERTEGWVAGVRLASLAIRDGADPDELLHGLAGNHTSVQEFLLEEVLDRLAPDRRRFLRNTANLAVLDPEMCDALTDRADSAEILRGLAADGLFVTPVEGGEHYRFHPLLAELLRYEQRREDPDAAREQHRRAAEWLVERRREIEAIEHLLAAGDHSRAHQLVIDFFRPLYVGSHRRDLDRWLDAMPEAVISESLDRAVDHAVALSLVASPDTTRWWAFCSERIGPDDRTARSRLDGVIAMHHAVNGRLPELRRHRDASRERRPPEHEDPLDEIIAAWEARLEAHLGDPAVAVDVARALVATPRRLLPDVSALSVLSGALDAAGRLDDARAVADRAVDLWRSSGEPELPAMLDVFVVKARAARQDGDLDLADELVDTALAFPPPRSGPHVLTAIALIERARIDHTRGGAAWRAQLVVLAEELRLGEAPAALIDWVERVRAEVESAEPGIEAPPELARPTSSSGLVNDLTGRELVILRLLASHLSLPEIGDELHISRHTVKSHVRRIYSKLGASSRSDAVRRAGQLGLLADRRVLQQAR